MDNTGFYCRNYICFFPYQSGDPRCRNRRQKRQVFISRRRALRRVKMRLKWGAFREFTLKALRLIIVSNHIFYLAIRKLRRPCKVKCSVRKIGQEAMAGRFLRLFLVEFFVFSCAEFQRAKANFFERQALTSPSPNFSFFNARFLARNSGLKQKKSLGKIPPRP